MACSNFLGSDRIWDTSLHFVHRLPDITPAALPGALGHQQAGVPGQLPGFLQEVPLQRLRGGLGPPEPCAASHGQPYAAGVLKGWGPFHRRPGGFGRPDLPALAGDDFLCAYSWTKIFIREAFLVPRDAVSAREDFYRGYVKGYEEGLNKAWDELIGLTTKGFSSREIQVMAKSKRQSIGDSVRDVKTGIRDETGIDLLARAAPKVPRPEVEAGSAYLVESMYATKALTVVNQLTADGTKALCILRSFPGNFQDGLNDSVRAVWLTKQESGRYGNFEVISPLDMAASPPGHAAS